MAVNYQIRYATHPKDFVAYDTTRIREEFLIEDLFIADEINMVYSMYDRFIVGGAFPVRKKPELETIDPIKAEFFLRRRELGIINVGGAGIVKVGEVEYRLQNKDAFYVGMGDRLVTFASVNPKNPAMFYFNSAPAHRSCPDALITLEQARKLEMGSLETSNQRTINQIIINAIVETCQLQMGMTLLKPGSVWNTMPPHVHSRRMEAYFYFEVPDNQAVCHFMGQPHETRPIWMKNHQAVLSPSWSIHAAAGTSNYAFIWGMAGENLDYSDMDAAKISDLK
ncbi:MAG TPA: 5-dehydro-4-deoxy-D-glucuronate isomerase [Bacteroidales bacterium]|nr:5-dehydro-4-deoxy-D-glucuronate isomerase [Bacteroidales bacterium]